MASTVYDKLIDRESGASIISSAEHAHIHESRYFTCTGKVSVAAAASLDVLFSFGVGQVGHQTFIEFTFDEGPVSVELYENVTTTSDGTPANVRNHNRISRLDSGEAAITFSPISPVVSVDDLLYEKYFPSGGNNQGLIVKRASSEWIFGPYNGLAQKYLWRITNESNGTITLGYEFEGYELP